MNVLCFDIETVPDTEFGRRLYGLGDLSDVDVARIMFAKRREQTGESDFLKLPMHRVVAISCVFRSSTRFVVTSLGDVETSESELIQLFYDKIARHSPTLVSWNGSGFDLPVLHYRALRHGISAPRYWEAGEGDRDFRFNNYLQRYHTRHTDLMDVLAGYQPRAVAPLDEVAKLVGLPGKLDMSGKDVWDRYCRGEIAEIRNYCETDVLNTWLLYLRFEQMRGHLDAEDLAREEGLVRSALADAGAAHLKGFLDAWRS